MHEHYYEADGRRAGRQAPRRQAWDTTGATQRAWDPYRYYRHGEIGLTTRYIIAPRTDGLLGVLEMGVTVGDLLIAAAVAGIMWLWIWAAWAAFGA